MTVKIIGLCGMVLFGQMAFAQNQDKAGNAKQKQGQEQKAEAERGNKTSGENKAATDSKGQQMKELNETYNQRKRAIMNDENLSKTEKQDKLKALNKQHNADMDRINGADRKEDGQAEKQKMEGERKEMGEKGEKNEKGSKDKPKQKN